MAMVNGTTVNKHIVDPFGMPVKPTGELSAEEFEGDFFHRENRMTYKCNSYDSRSRKEKK